MSRLKSCLLAILDVMILVTFASPAQASEKVTVCPASFPATGAISAAVATAASGTTIELCPGVYYDNVVVNQAKVKIIGQGKNSTVDVYCADAGGTAFYLEANDDYVQNMKITDCKWGVFIDGTLGGKDGVIRDNIFTSNEVGVEAYRTTTATVQANFFINNGTAVLDNGSTSSDIGSNTVVGRCGSVTTEVSTNVESVDCSNVFGIFLDGASKASVNSNHVTQVSEGVAVFGGTTGSKITKNKVWKCFEAFYMDQAGNNTFTGNEANASAVGFLATSTTGQDSTNGKPNVIENNQAQGNQYDDLLDQSIGSESDGVANKWHKNKCGGTGSSPTSLCTD